MKRIVSVYQLLTSYLIPVFRDIAESDRVQLQVIYGPPIPEEGFGEHLPFDHPNISWLEVEDKHPFGDRLGMYYKGLLHHLFTNRPDAIMIWANPRYLSFWGILIFGYLFNIKIYPRGHGLFKKVQPHILYRVMYKAILSLSYKYICYTPAVKKSLLPLVNREEKLAVDYNTLTNEAPILPDLKTGQENGIFYIGRVRPGCGVEELILAVQHLNEHEGFNINLHVIGGGLLEQCLQEKKLQFSWLNYYGKVFDQKRISEISLQCRFGCVPGFMGLNVVHMMSLSLPVVTHGQLHRHMGPEPEYIQSQSNGWLMEKPNDLSALMNLIRELWLMPKDKFKIVQQQAYRTYEKLSEPPYHERLLRILEA